MNCRNLHALQSARLQTLTSQGSARTIVLDTNVLSELMRPIPALEITNWLSQLTPDQVLVTTVITVHEIQYGLSRLADSHKKNSLKVQFAKFVGPTSKLGVLSLDTMAAQLSGELRGLRESQGLHAQSADMMIAAITKTANAALATRNEKDFSSTGIEIINPWRI